MSFPSPIGRSSPHTQSSNISQYEGNTTSTPSIERKESGLNWSSLLHFFKPDESGWIANFTRSVRALIKKDAITVNDLLQFTSEQINRLIQSRKGVYFHPNTIITACEQDDSKRELLLKLLPQTAEYFLSGRAKIAKESASLLSSLQASLRTLNEGDILEKKKLIHQWVKDQTELELKASIQPPASQQSKEKEEIDALIRNKQALCAAILKDIDRVGYGNEDAGSSTWFSKEMLAHCLRLCGKSLSDEAISMISNLLAKNNMQVEPEDIAKLCPDILRKLHAIVGDSLPQALIKKAILSTQDDKKRAELLPFLEESELKALIRLVFDLRKKEKAIAFLDVTTELQARKDELRRILIENQISPSTPIDDEFVSKCPIELLQILKEEHYLIPSFTLLKALKGLVKEQKGGKENQRLELLSRYYYEISEREEDVLKKILKNVEKNIEASPSLPPFPQRIKDFTQIQALMGSDNEQEESPRFHGELTHSSIYPSIEEESDDSPVPIPIGEISTGKRKEVPPEEIVLEEGGLDLPEIAEVGGASSSSEVTKKKRKKTLASQWEESEGSLDKKVLPALHNFCQENPSNVRLIALYGIEIPRFRSLKSINEFVSELSKKVRNIFEASEFDGSSLTEYFSPHKKLPSNVKTQLKERNDQIAWQLEKIVEALFYSEKELKVKKKDIYSRISSLPLHQAYYLVTAALQKFSALNDREALEAHFANRLLEALSSEDEKQEAVDVIHMMSKKPYFYEKVLQDLYSGKAFE